VLFRLFRLQSDTVCSKSPPPPPPPRGGGKRGSVEVPPLHRLSPSLCGVLRANGNLRAIKSLLRILNLYKVTCPEQLDFRSIIKALLSALQRCRQLLYLGASLKPISELIVRTSLLIPPPPPGGSSNSQIEYLLQQDLPPHNSLEPHTPPPPIPMTSQLSLHKCAPCMRSLNLMMCSSVFSNTLDCCRRGEIDPLTAIHQAAEYHQHLARLIELVVAPSLQALQVGLAPLAPASEFGKKVRCA
jgi:hypothetical protein